MLSSQKVNQQTTDTLVQLSHFKQQCRDYHDLLTNPTMDGDDIKVFYGTQLALQQLRKKEPGLTRPDGMTLTRIGYVAAIVNMERHKVGRTLMKLAEFGNGFLNRHMVPRRE